MENMRMENMTSEMLEKMSQIIESYRTYGVPDDFDDIDTHIEYNDVSGCVFLTNSEYQVAILDDYSRQLESWYFTPYAGHEGTLDDLLQMIEDGEIEDADDLEYISEILEYRGYEEIAEEVKAMIGSIEEVE